MSLSNPVTTVKDTTTFNLNEPDLISTCTGGPLKTPERNVPLPDGLKWWVQIHPIGIITEHQKHVSLYLCTSKAVSAKFSFKIDGSSIHSSTVYDFPEEVSNGYGFTKFATHEALRPLFVNGKLSITCVVEFDVFVPFVFLTPRVAQFCDHVSTDFELVVGSDRLSAHKSLLSLMSPVFHAMLSHDTVESKSGRIEITDFDFATVKTVIDFCYGKDMPTPTVEIVVGMLRFADKYCIRAVTNQLEKMPRRNLTTTTFPTIVQYAYDCSKNPLFAECAKFFKEHETEIKTTPNFVNLPLTLLVHVLKSAFKLRTFSGVFKHARNKGFTFIIEILQNLTSISFDTFPIAASYAWHNSNDNLKKMCATFFNVNRDAVLSMKAFVDLSPDVVCGVIKLGFILKNGVK